MLFRGVSALLLMNNIYVYSRLCWLTLFFLLTGQAARAQAPIWQTAIAAGGDSQVRATAPDGHGNVYIVGLFSYSVTFGSTTLNSAGGLDIFVAKWSSASNSFTWAQRVGSSGNELAQAVVVNGANVYVGGYFQSGSLNFGSIGLTNAGVNNLFVAKLTDAGNTSSWTWANAWEGPTMT